MKRLVILALLFLDLLFALSAFAGMPQLKSAKLVFAPYPVPFGYSNVVCVVYKSTSLGTVYSPFKPAAYFPATRNSVTIPILPGSYKFRATIQAQPAGESAPSNTLSYIAAP